MADFNDFGFSTVSEEDYKAQQSTEVNTAKAVVSTATASMKPELEKIESKIAGLTDSMRVLSDEMADRKEELNDKWGARMNEVEELVLPLLKNLAKDGDKKEYIRWPGRTDILNAIGEIGTKDEVILLIKLYEVSKRSNAQMNNLLTTTLGKIGDDKVIPILMEIAKNKNLPVNVRSRAVDVLSKKQAPELVDFFVEMLGDPVSRDKVNEFAFDVMGEMPEERMLMALLEAYQVGRHKYYSLLNTIINSLDNFDNPEIKSLYLEIAQTKDFPSNIRLKAFRGLTRYSDPEVVDGIVELLNDPENYIYYNEIVGMLHEFGVYDNYQDKLRMAAFKAMKKEAGFIGFAND